MLLFYCIMKVAILQNIEPRSLHTLDFSFLICFPLLQSMMYAVWAVDYVMELR